MVVVTGLKYTALLITIFLHPFKRKNKQKNACGVFQEHDLTPVTAGNISLRSQGVCSFSNNCQIFLWKDFLRWFGATAHKAQAAALDCML